MSGSEPTDEEPGEAPSPRRPGSGRPLWIAVVAGGLALLVAGLAWIGGQELLRVGEDDAVPEFPSLAANPDRTLHGTVAYFDDASRCVRVVAAAGSPSRTVHCLPAEDAARTKQLGKAAGPQLVWRPDGRLEVTLFRWKPSEDATRPPPMAADWQKVVDVRTGKAEDVPSDQLPTAPATTAPHTVNGRGERLRTTFDALRGTGTVTLSTASGSRRLLTVDGPDKYTYRLDPAFWAPTDDWAATSDDGRILVITPSSPPRTRVLVTGSGGGAGGGNAGPAYAVTAEDLLTTAP